MKRSIKHPFEHNVLLLACILGLVRSTLAVLGDLDDLTSHPDFITDILFTLLFLLNLLSIQFLKSFKWLLYSFYIPFISLLIYTFYMAGGIQEGIEHNIYIGLIFLNFTTKNRLPLYFSMLLVIGSIAVIILVEVQGIQSLNSIQDHANRLNFLFATLGIISLTFYAKHVFVSRREKLKLNSIELKIRGEELGRKRDHLSLQKEELEKLTIALDGKATQKTKAIANQKKRREKYLSLTTYELRTKYERTISLIKEITNNTQQDSLIDMLNESGDRLKKEIDELIRKVKNND